MDDFSSEDYWRTIILYGLNVATYKIALAKSLYSFSKAGITNVSIQQLSKEFFDQFNKRLHNGMPQLNNSSRQTKMEYIVSLYYIGKVTEEEAIEYVGRNAFSDVIPRFHTVNDEKVPISFYEYSGTGLVLTDNLFDVFSSIHEQSLVSEVDSRWSLLEAAFLLKKGNAELVNDIRHFYLSSGYRRTDITGMVPVLNGYQKGICFYCGESMDGHDIHVDHVIPRQVVSHDEVWNLVLAHAFCNEQKSDSLPSRKYITKLIERNEHFIASNHPIKQKIIRATGITAQERRNYINKVYDDVKQVIPYTWEGIRGYNPDTDEFYKSFIRSIIKW